MCFISLLLQKRVVQMSVRGETCLRMTHVHEFTYICHTEGLHWQYPAIWKPSFMKWRLDNKQSKILQPLVSDKCLSLLYGETDLLSSKHDIKGLGFVVIFWEFCFSCMGERFSFTLEQRGKDVENKHREQILLEWLYRVTQWWDVVLGYLSQRYLSDLPWQFMQQIAEVAWGPDSGSTSSLECLCPPVCPCLLGCLSMNHYRHPDPGRKTEVTRKISPVSRKRQEYF